ncbi:MAG: non-specific serine/threonine protein kinase [Myxococcota bacterium]|jgi:non-specific serine/threonine protein kinase
MTGGELVDAERLVSLWTVMSNALTEVATPHGGVWPWLRTVDSTWQTRGRICLHLAENKDNRTHPFAFLATYARERHDGSVQHVPLAQALREYANANDRHSLRELLVPVQYAAQSSELIAALVHSRQIYSPLAWTAEQAHAFLMQLPLFEASGLTVRVPNWWKTKRVARVQVTVGEDPPSMLGLGAMLSFNVSVAIGGDILTRAEIEQLLLQDAGLAMVRGNWVEVDSDKLRELLDRWDHAADGLSVGDSLRLLAESDDEDAHDLDDRPDWQQVTAGDWLRNCLDALRNPAVGQEIRDGAGLNATLRAYQQTGVQWMSSLFSLGLGGCLADDMGLGKTIQVIALLSLLHRESPGPDLLVLPASLIGNWQAELARFAPHLPVLTAHSSAMPASELAAMSADQLAAGGIVLTTYGTLLRNETMAKVDWRCVILDEAQAIKNPSAKQTRAVKAVPSRFRLAMTGTPVENRLGDLWSLLDFLNPGLLGTAKAFTQRTKSMASDSNDGFAPLRRLVQPYILRRLKTDRSIAPDLPDKTEVVAHCTLTKRQATLYQQAVKELAAAIESSDGVARRGIILSYLLRFKQLCNHPSQWLGDGAFEPRDSGKFARLAEIIEPIAARQDKVLVFTQFRAMIDPLRRFLASLFARDGLVIHGGTRVSKRQEHVLAFQQDERIPFMVLSLKAAGTGLNLTAANHVIHVDRWWNPAVEDQATDRAYRIGQHRNVLVHKFVCTGTIEERIDAMINAKRDISDAVLGSDAPPALTELSNDELLAMVRLDLDRAVLS